MRNERVNIRSHITAFQCEKFINASMIILLVFFFSMPLVLFRMLLLYSFDRIYWECCCCCFFLSLSLSLEWTRMSVSPSMSVRSHRARALLFLFKFPPQMLFIALMQICCVHTVRGCVRAHTLPRDKIEKNEKKHTLFDPN